MAALARLALLLAALAAWRGGSRPVAVALAVAVAASTASTLPLPARVAYVLRLLIPAASAWLALRVATGRGWPVVLAWLALAVWAALAPRGSPWAAVRISARHVAVAVEVYALARIGRPRGRTATSTAVLAVGDVAALLVPMLGAGWWPAQGQCVIVSAGLLWIHRDVFSCARG